MFQIVDTIDEVREYLQDNVRLSANSCMSLDDTEFANMEEDVSSGHVYYLIYESSDPFNQGYIRLLEVKEIDEEDNCPYTDEIAAIDFLFPGGSPITRSARSGDDFGSMYDHLEELAQTVHDETNYTWLYVNAERRGIKRWAEQVAESRGLNLDDLLMDVTLAVPDKIVKGHFNSEVKEYTVIDLFELFGIINRD
ncbi:MAG: hypothetical protein ABIH82_01510 [Candidatus Woesearchaeota archaeon]